MRAQIFDALYARMKRDESVFLVIADMGINLVERFAESFPRRFVNVGIAEQNMVGVCAGLANCGLRPVAYTISNFAVHRCFEQIRNDVAIHQTPMVILGIGTGYDNAALGPTHHILDDWGSIRGFPGIEIHSPSSNTYAAGLLDDLLDRRVPAYVRIPKSESRFPESADPLVYLPGVERQTLLVTYGGLAPEAAEVRQLRPDWSLMVVNRLRPLQEDVFTAALREHRRIVVFEDHFAETGLWSSISQLVAKHGISIELHSRSPAGYTLTVGTSPKYFLRSFRGDAQSLVQDFG
jgi:transketolase